MNKRAEYISVDDEKNNRIQKISETFSMCYDEIEKSGEPSRETSLVMTKLEEAQFWAIKGITREGK